MITIIICIVIFGIIGAVIDESQRKLTVSIGALIGFIIGEFLAIALSDSLPTKYVLINELELAAIKENCFLALDNNNKFQLYYIFKKPFYYIFEKRSNGEIYLNELPVDDVSVIKTENRALVKIYKKQFLKESFYRWTIQSPDEVKYEVYIPIKSAICSFR